MSQEKIWYENEEKRQTNGGLCYGKYLIKYNNIGDI